VKNEVNMHTGGQTKGCEEEFGSIAFAPSGMLRVVIRHFRGKIDARRRRLQSTIASLEKIVAQKENPPKLRLVNDDVLGDKRTKTASRHVLYRDNKRVKQQSLETGGEREKTGGKEKGEKRRRWGTLLFFHRERKRKWEASRGVSIIILIVDLQ